MKKNMMFTFALAAVMSLTGCGSAQNNENSTPSQTAETTAATTAETTSDTAQTEALTTASAAQSESAPAETQSSKAAETTIRSSAAGETAITTASAFDLDAMISSAEAMIPKITAFTGLPAVTLDSKTQTVSTVSSAANHTETAAVTTASSAKQTSQPAVTNTAPTGSVTSMYSVIFDGTPYTLPISGTLPLPAGWSADQGSLGNSVTRFINNNYNNTEITEVKRGGNKLNGVFLAVIHAMQKGGAYPALQMYKGITWGSTAEEIKAQYGEPAHSSEYKQYDCKMTTMYYTQNDGSYLVLHIADTYGLALIEMYKN